MTAACCAFLVTAWLPTGPPRQRSDEGLQPGKAAEVPLPGAGGTPRERLARDVAQRNERLSSGLEQVTKIFKQAQQQASEALTQARSPHLLALGPSASADMAHHSAPIGAVHSARPAGGRTKPC